MNGDKIINDPVCGYIRVPEGLVLDVLNHPFVQRLGRIKQMGVSNLVYPGALHSRLGHSLGAMHLMATTLESLRSKGVQLVPSEVQATTIAMLLHDLGHGPFSHVLEQTLVEGISHENLSLLLMQQLNADLRSKGQGTLWKNLGPLDEAIAIFQGQYLRPFFHQLVSGALDVDRMDYLCRDAFFCGVQEGSIDTLRLIAMFDVLNDKLVVHEKGIFSVEKFLLARRFMFWQVYLHKTSVGAERLLINVLNRAKRLLREGVDLPCAPALRFFLERPIRTDQFFPQSEALRNYALLDDSDIESALKSWTGSEDKVLSLLSSAFINRQLYKARLLSEPLSASETEQLQNQYALSLGISKDDTRYFFEEHVMHKEAYGGGIDILRRDGTVCELSQLSDVVRALRGQQEQRWLYYWKN